MNRLRPFAAVVAAACALATTVPLSALPPDEAAAWRSDLALARARLLEIHPDPWRKVSRDEVETAFGRLESRLPELSPAAAVVGLAKIFAALGDGHTRLTLPLPAGAGFVEGHLSTAPPRLAGLAFHTLPLRLGIYEEGVFVERIAARHAALAGSRVVAVGGVKIDEAMARLAPVVRHDNREQLRDLLPMHLVVPELLHVEGLAADPRRSTWTLVGPDGRRHELALAASDDEGAVAWATALAPTATRAASYRHLQAGFAPRRGAFSGAYRFARLDESGTIYLQYNLAQDDGEEPLVDFAARLRAALAEPGVARLILDLRWNWGGDNSLNRPLLHALLASEKLREPGAFVVLVGRGTFSAAMMFAVDLERHLRPILAGEPTGSSPNHAGDARRIELPATGLTLRISTLWWQYGGPRDAREAIEPHLALPPRWSEVVAGRDGALEALLASPAASLVGRWRGTITPPTQRFPLELAIDERQGELAGRLSAGPLGSDLAFDGLLRDGARIAFRATRDGGSLDFAGVLIGERIVGRVIYAGLRHEPFAFALERAP
jgi:hypothetical protein